MVKWTAQGVSRQKVAAIANDMGILSPGATVQRRPDASAKPVRKFSGLWHAASVTRWLNDDALIGTYQPHKVSNRVRTPRGEPIESYYPAVVSVDLLRRARAVMAAQGIGKWGDAPNRAVRVKRSATYSAAG